MAPWAVSLYSPFPIHWPLEEAATVSSSHCPWLPSSQTHNWANAAPPLPMPMTLLQDPVHTGLPPDPLLPTEPTAWLWGFNVLVKWAMEPVTCFCSLLVSGYAGVVSVSCKGLEGPGLSQLSERQTHGAVGRNTYTWISAWVSMDVISSTKFFLQTSGSLLGCMLESPWDLWDTLMPGYILTSEISICWGRTQARVRLQVSQEGLRIHAPTRTTLLNVTVRASRVGTSFKGRF